MDIKGVSGETSDVNEEDMVRLQKKGDPSYEVAKYLAELNMVFCGRQNF